MEKIEQKWKKGKWKMEKGKGKRENGKGKGGRFWLLSYVCLQCIVRG